MWFVDRECPLRPTAEAVGFRSHYVREANEDLEYGNIVESIADQDDPKLYILRGIALLSTAEMTPARTKTVHEAYSRVSRAYNEQPLTQRGMFNHLSKLVMFGFIKTKEINKGASGGQWNEHEFSDDVDIEKVRDAFNERDIEWLDVSQRGIKQE